MAHRVQKPRLLDACRDNPSGHISTSPGKQPAHYDCLQFRQGNQDYAPADTI